jgi:quinol monooxygenase YgiN
MIVLIVHMTIQPGKQEECIRILRELTAETLKEPGCVQYVTHQSTENPLSFAFYESYADQAALDAHRASPHYARYIRGGIDALCDSRTRELFVPLR